MLRPSWGQQPLRRMTDSSPLKQTASSCSSGWHEDIVHYTWSASPWVMLQGSMVHTRRVQIFALLLLLAFMYAGDGSRAAFHEIMTPESTCQLHLLVCLVPLGP